PTPAATPTPTPVIAPEATVAPAPTAAPTPVPFSQSVPTLPPPPVPPALVVPKSVPTTANGRVTLAVTCPSGQTCTATVKIVAKVKKGKKTVDVVVGQGQVSAGGTSVVITLTAAGKKLLKDAKGGTLAVTVQTIPAVGKATSSSTRLKAAKKAPKKAKKTAVAV
ncbi:MAG: hypothetical protein Q7T55_17465, partial [Solirubrobacteraceae bacterium]|nr:hypothetical protein [Solirubrobacteraceae bacterium]